MASIRLVNDLASAMSCYNDYSLLRKFHHAKADTRLLRQHIGDVYSRFNLVKPTGETHLCTWHWAFNGAPNPTYYYAVVFYLVFVFGLNVVCSETQPAKQWRQSDFFGGRDVRIFYLCQLRFNQFSLAKRLAAGHVCDGFNLGHVAEWDDCIGGETGM